MQENRQQFTAMANNRITYGALRKIQLERPTPDLVTHNLLGWSLGVFVYLFLFFLFFF